MFPHKVTQTDRQTDTLKLSMGGSSLISDGGGGGGGVILNLYFT